MTLSEKWALLLVLVCALAAILIHKYGSIEHRWYAYVLGFVGVTVFLGFAMARMVKI